jgi:hypothetical protein
LARSKLSVLVYFVDKNEAMLSDIEPELNEYVRDANPARALMAVAALREIVAKIPQAAPRATDVIMKVLATTTSPALALAILKPLPGTQSCEIGVFIYFFFLCPPSRKN